MQFSIIHPSRSRPQRSLSTIQNWLDRSGKVSVEVLVSLDTDDPCLASYISNYVHYSNKEVRLIYNNNTCAVDAINYAAQKSTGDILIVVSEDEDCPDDWGELILKEVEGKSDWVLKTQDGIQRWIITMPVMDRKYYERFEYIYFPGYSHMFCDTELTCVADLLGRKITCDLLFKHLHYSTGQSEKDQVNEKADATWEQGKQLFLQRYKDNFGLKGDLGLIQDVGMIKWANANSRI